MVRQMVENAFEALHDNSLPTIELLQTSFPHKSQLMINISIFFDPKYVFLIYAPLLFALNRRVGHRLVQALVLTEWLNQLLKWLLAGERPYWYAGERAQAANQTLLGSGIQSYDFGANVAAPSPGLGLRQFPVTCELGAGSPSGHAMVTATVWYILADAYLRGELLGAGAGGAQANVRARQAAAAAAAKPAPNLATLAWTSYTLALLAVSLSRVYLACHFPHQCLGGALLGALVAKLVAERMPAAHLRPQHFLWATALMFGSVMCLYAAMRALGLDPLWSVQKGLRWCAKREYIHLDTTPFYSMTRYLGFGLGAGLAFNGAAAAAAAAAPTSSPAKQPAAHLLAADTGLRLAAGLVSVLVGQALLALPLPKQHMNLFYAISFALYALFAFVMADTVPRAAKRLRRHLARAPAALAVAQPRPKSAQ